MPRHYDDTSPWYGLGPCERRFGGVLHGKKREDVVLSSNADEDPGGG
jgi:D-threo-aldose 1-dehydrogenase